MAAEILRRVAADIRTHRVRSVRIGGHTDSSGTPHHNQRLSESRAEAVERWLVREGQLSNVKMTRVGYGATRPIASNTRPDGTADRVAMARNRRVTIVLER